MFFFVSVLFLFCVPHSLCPYVSVCSPSFSPYTGATQNDDAMWKHTVKALPEAVDYIAEGHKAGENVLVHCSLGRNRSPTVATAFLMKHLGITLEDALTMMAYRYSYGHPDGFNLHLLTRYEEALKTGEPLQPPGPDDAMPVARLLELDDVMVAAQAVRAAEKQAANEQRESKQ